MAETLTPQQRQAVENRGGRLLVSAAAGSGKTKVLVDRLMGYLTDPEDSANLDEFLIITYTKAAASELRGKIAAKLSQRIAQEPENRHLQKQMQRLFLTKISTVHGFCSDLLREYAFRLDLPADFRVADENQAMELRQQVLDALLERAYEEPEGDFRAFVDSQGLGRDDRLVPELIQKVYDSARCHLNPQLWLDTCLQDLEGSSKVDAAQTPWGRYLMEDLRDYLDCQIRVLKICAQGARDSEGMEKAAANLQALLAQLEGLRNAGSWDEIQKNRAIDYGRLTFPRKNLDEDLAARIKAARNACKLGLEKRLRSFADPSDQLLKDLQASVPGVRGLISLVRQFDDGYAALKKGRRILDFGDLEHRALDLLLGKSRSGPTAAAREIAQRYREIMVDEYQDSNGVQDAIFSALTDQRQNGFLVGDVKQSIYQFRLADPGIFLDKYQKYVPADQAQLGQGRKVLLSHNFRSGPEVIAAVNDVFSLCMSPAVGGLRYGQQEALREGIPHAPLAGSVELHAIEVREESYPEEAAFVASRIQAMLRKGTPIRQGEGLRPVEPGDIVILLRSPGSAAQYFQNALEAVGIPCTSGAGRDLLQTPEVQTFRALLEVVLNPRQDIPLLAALASPIFGFTADDLAAIRARQKQGCFYDALLEGEGEKVGFFLDTLRRLRRTARLEKLTVLLEQAMALTHLDSVYAAMGEGRQENLREFYQLASSCEAGSQMDLQQFLEHLRALEEKGVLAASAPGGDSVNIMSIHKSKGLEFPVVFLCNLSRKFNQEALRAQVLCDQELGLGLNVADRETRVRYPSLAKAAIAAKMAAQSLSEEMRVLYVAMTRARDRLVMTYAAKNLAGVLEDGALRLDFDGGELLCRDALSMGDWVLLAAIQRTEAGALHGLGSRPRETRLGEYPWVIGVEEAPELAAGRNFQGEAPDLPPQTLDMLERALSFSYPHQAATHAPSKQTATGRKGRAKDEEAAEKTLLPSLHGDAWRSASFPKSRGREYGTAMHKVLQYLRFEGCGSEAGVAREVSRLVAEQYITQEQGQLVDCGKLARFFETPFGRKLVEGAPCLREFKFSVLDRGEHYGPGLEGEQVLLQGVVDCALLEEDGITVVDFKTDRVTSETLAATAQKYAPQLATYAEALERIYECQVKEKILYFFQLERFVKV